MQSEGFASDSADFHHFPVKVVSSIELINPSTNGAMLSCTILSIMMLWQLTNSSVSILEIEWNRIIFQSNLLGTFYVDLNTTCTWGERTLNLAFICLWSSCSS